MQDTGRSPLHLLLDGRTSRDGAHGFDRRRRARGLARQPRTPRRQEDQGRPGKEGRHRVQEAHRQHHARTGHDERVRAQTVQTAQDAGRRGQAREPVGPRVRRLRPAHASGERLTYIRVGGGRAYVCLLVDLANRGIAGHSAGPVRDAGLVPAAFAALDFPLADVQVFHTDRGSEFDNRRIDELLDVFDIGRSLSRKGNPYDNAVVESTNRLLRKELIYRNPVRHNRAVETRPRRLRVLVRRPEAPLHPRIPEPEGIHRARTRPLRNCPTHRCQSTRSGCTSPWATHRKRWKPSIMRTKRRKPPRYKGGTKIRPYQFVGARRCD